MQEASRALYRDEVDFAALAAVDADFRKYVRPNGQLDFSSPAAVKQLSISLLRRDFDLQVELPDDRLCPPIPNRLNFIHWLQDLVDSTAPSFTEGCDPERLVTALDIGCGASCIYPLLGCATRPKWRFLATDIDDRNYNFAARNIKNNDLTHRIRLHRSQPDDPLLPLDKFEIPFIDIALTNPPFYSSTGEMLAAAAAKSRPPRSACTGADVEMVTAGGEVAFVRRLLRESRDLGPRRLGWCACMLGKRESVAAVIEAARNLDDPGPTSARDKASDHHQSRPSHRIQNWAVGELVQGRHTRRWVVAWSWGSYRAGPALVRGFPSLAKSLTPFPPIMHLSVPSPSSRASDESTENAIHDIASRIDVAVRGLDVRWRFNSSSAAGLMFAQENVWGRRARRQHLHPPSTQPSDHTPGKENDDIKAEPALGIRVRVLDTNATRAQDDGEGQSMSQHTERGREGIEVELRWVFGQDSVLFESFAGWLRRQLREGVDTI